MVGSCAELVTSGAGGVGGKGEQEPDSSVKGLLGVVGVSRKVTLGRGGADSGVDAVTVDAGNLRGERVRQMSRESLMGGTKICADIVNERGFSSVTTSGGLTS